MPNRVMFELTNHCNLHCKMCGIWEEPNKKNIDLKKYENILKDKILNKIRYIALTGGEPFLLTNLEEYYGLVKKYFPKVYINISTNGFLTKRTINFLNSIDTKRLSITISYDGIKNHDSIRRVNGSREKLLETAVNIKNNHPQIELSLKMTITNENYSEILTTANQCKDLEISFRFKTLEKLNNCQQSRFPAEIKEPNYSKDILDSITKQAKKILDLNIETNTNYVKNLIKKNSGKHLPCSCSTKKLFIAIDGNVFLCRKKEPIGNINIDTLSDIWVSYQKKSIVNDMNNCEDSTQSLSFIHN